MAETRFTEQDHRRAFELWRQGKSLRQISESDPHLPGKTMLGKWKKEDFDCAYDCEWHGWEKLHNEIVSEALEEFEEDMPDLVEREKKRLQFLYSLEREITEIMEAGELDRPRTMKDAVDLLESIYNQQRLIKGESTEITEMRGADHKELNLQKVMNQLNVGEDVSEEQLIDAMEDQITDG